MFSTKDILILFLSLLICSSAFADYEITGKLNLSSDWQHQIFLSTIDKLDDYYNANPNDIIQVGNINEDGTFTLSGNNLPLEPRYYQLYLVKEENSEYDACLYTRGDDHNFIHIILDNTTKVDIQSDPSTATPFGNYSLEGDPANMSLRDLNEMIFPSFYFYEIKFPSELQFSQQKFNRDLIHFSDTSQHILVALAAIINTDMDQYFELESQKYLYFSERLNSELSNHSYTDDYMRKMNYYNGASSNTSIPSWIIALIIILVIGLFAALLKIANLNNQLQQASHPDTNYNPHPSPSLTKQEEKILFLILEEKSNKEIASELYIELSTVKTHINKLYAKLGAKNRTDAKSIAKSLKPSTINH